jgi:putative membrane protein
MHRAFAALLIAGSLTSPALAQSPQGTPPRAELSADDKAFLDFVAEDNQAEIELCLLAQRVSRSPVVKAFARLMVHDHVGIESRLAALSDAENVRVAHGVGKEGGETLARLQKLDGAGFDAEFMRAQIEDHHHDLDRFKQQESTTKNERVRRFASETVATLGQHHELAELILSSVAKSPR